MKTINLFLILIILFTLSLISNSQVTQQWASSYNGPPINSSDRASSMVLDASGNVYVTGESAGDYATIKYNSFGAILWVSRYNGTGNGYDDAASITVDGSGNVYVTGQSLGSGTSYDYATIKYNSSGVQQWVSRYNGPVNSSDNAFSIAVDGSGNVYVTGYSPGSGTSFDYATIKYNSSGAQQWEARYNGTGNAADYATALAIDGSGNVYVTGQSSGSGTGNDYVTIKYNSSGVQQWAQVYNGPGNGNDQATSIAVDGSGNIYVTGGSPGSGTSTDYATIKYNSSGVQQWVSRYNGPANYVDQATSIRVDVSGNVYITGQSEGSGTAADYATIKYNSSGAQQWASRYNGTGNGMDAAYSIVVVSGSVFVTGSSRGSGAYSGFATVGYNSSGTQTWVQRFDSPAGNSSGEAIAFDQINGNIWITGYYYDYGSGSNHDYMTMKYGTSGLILFIAPYFGQGTLDEAYSTAVDASGNVYVTGCSRTGLTSATSDFVTIKYNSAGAQQWTARYNAPANGEDIAYSVAVDGSGNVYVTGTATGISSGFDCTTIKYNSSGTQQWVAGYNGPGNSTDEARSVAVDASGNVYVTGKSIGSGTNYDYITIKYNSSGAQQWASRYNGPSGGIDDARFLKLDASGNVYVSGSSAGTTTSDDYATVKYNSAGAQQWASRYDGTGNGNDFPNSLAVDGSGNVYVTGRSVSPGPNYDYATVKYNSSGAQQWASRYNGPGSGSDEALSITADGSGNVYVTGTSAGSGTGYDYATIKYNSSGAQQWASRYNGPVNGSDDGNSIVLDALGNVYVAGQSTGNGTNYDFATIKYSSSGSQLWEARYNGTGNSSDIVHSMAIDGSGNVYVAGSSVGIGTDDDYLTIKYSQLVGVQPETNEIPEEYFLYNNYPNPFNPVTNIKFQIPAAGFVKLSVFDLLGREVETLVNEKLGAGIYNAEWSASNYPSGVYFYRVQYGDINEVKKMILVK